MSVVHIHWLLQHVMSSQSCQVARPCHSSQVVLNVSSPYPLASAPIGSTIASGICGGLNCASHQAVRRSLLSSRYLCSNCFFVFSSRTRCTARARRSRATSMTASRTATSCLRLSCIVVEVVAFVVLVVRAPLFLSIQPSFLSMFQRAPIVIRGNVFFSLSTSRPIAVTRLGFYIRSA
jgi:hypothetical protein